MARLRPYLVRATYEWIVDHDLTPYILVDVDQDNVEVPWEYVENGKIVLNASPMAVRNLQLENDFVSFEASFGGSAWQIFIPSSAVLAVYARESGQGVYAREEGHGMLVNEGESDDDLDPTPQDPKPQRGGLRLVK
jgi:stringent starvation protein B